MGHEARASKECEENGRRLKLCACCRPPPGVSQLCLWTAESLQVLLLIAFSVLLCGAGSWNNGRFIVALETFFTHVFDDLVRGQ